MNSVKVRGLLLAALLIFLMSTAAFPGGGDESSGRFPYRHLSWADFHVDDKSEGLSAQTETYIAYQYTGRAQKKNGVFTAWVLKIGFEGGFDREKSWRRSAVALDNTLLLEHEQGHFALNELKLRQLRGLPLSTFPQGTGTSANAALDDLRTKLNDFYKTEMKDLDTTQKRYDNETDFGTIHDEQHAWTTRLEHALAALPGTAR